MKTLGVYQYHGIVSTGRALYKSGLCERLCDLLSVHNFLDDTQPHEFGGPRGAAVRELNQPRVAHVVVAVAGYK